MFICIFFFLFKRVNNKKQEQLFFYIWVVAIIGAHTHTQSEKTYLCHYFGQRMCLLHKNAFSTVVLKVEYFPLEQFAQLRLARAVCGNVDRAFTQAFVYTQFFSRRFSFWLERYAIVSSLRPRHNLCKGMLWWPWYQNTAPHGGWEKCIFTFFACYVHALQLILLFVGWTMTYQRVGSGNIELTYLAVFFFSWLRVWLNWMVDLFIFLIWKRYGVRYSQSISNHANDLVTIPSQPTTRQCLPFSITSHFFQTSTSFTSLTFVYRSTSHRTVILIPAHLSSNQIYTLSILMHITHLENVLHPVQVIGCGWSQ